MKRIKTASEAWWFLENHPAFLRPFDKKGEFKDGHFQAALDIWISDKGVMLECGEWMYPTKGEKKMWPDYLGSYCHDIRLDCGGETFEEAIIKLANLVKKHLGDKQVNFYAR